MSLLWFVFFVHVPDFVLALCWCALVVFVVLARVRCSCPCLLFFVRVMFRVRGSLLLLLFCSLVLLSLLFLFVLMFFVRIVVIVIAIGRVLVLWPCSVLLLWFFVICHVLFAIVRVRCSCALFVLFVMILLR